MTLNKIIHNEFSKLIIKRYHESNWTTEDETKYQEIMKFLSGDRLAQSEGDLIRRLK